MTHLLLSMSIKAMNSLIFKELQRTKVLDTRFRGFDGGETRTYLANFDSRILRSKDSAVEEQELYCLTSPK
jgi:hypothetical protein